MTRRVDRFRVVRGGLILAFGYTQLLECVKEWSDFEEMDGVLRVVYWLVPGRLLLVTVCRATIFHCGSA